MVWPVLAAGFGGALGLFGAREQAKATDNASRLASEAQVRAAEIAAKNALQTQDRLFKFQSRFAGEEFDRQKLAQELETFTFNPARQIIEGAYATSPLGQKEQRQQFYNTKALQQSLAGRGDSLVSFGNTSRFYSV